LLDWGDIVLIKMREHYQLDSSLRGQYNFPFKLWSINKEYVENYLQILSLSKCLSFLYKFKCIGFVAPQILIVLFLIYLFDNIIQLISLRSLWYYGGW
jgi:hypothetical protein